MMNADEKKCPRCAETIKAQAYVCRFCNLNFSAWPKAAGGAPRKGGAKWPVAIIVAIVVVVMGLSLSGGNRDETAAAPVANEPTAAAPEARRVTIKELFDAYEANEVRAQQEYGAQPLIVTATVRNVDLDLTDDPFVRLEDSGYRLNAYFDKDNGGGAAGDLVKGQVTTIWCAEVSEVLGTPGISQCQVMPSAK